MQFFLALIISTFIGGIAGYIGSLMVTKRMALMGGALGHLTLPGIALAMLYKFDISIGASLFLSLGIILIWFFQIKTELPLEAITAVVFASSMATTFLFLPESKAIPALIGDINSITILNTVITILVASITFIITKMIFSKMILILISKDLAHVEKINVKKYNFIYLLSIALTIALGVRIVGGLMTAALVAIPACTSRNLSKNLFQYSYGSMIIGIISCLSGILAFKYISIPAGPAIIISNSILFLISLILKNN